MAKPIDALPAVGPFKKLPPLPLGLQRALRGDSAAMRNLLQLLVAVAQFALLAQLLRTFQLESRAFRVVTALSCVAFPIHHCLPARYRLPFFAAVSVGSIGLVVGVTNAAYIVLLGGILIGLAHLPIAFWARVALQLVFVAFLGAMRVEAIATPVPQVIWPVLGAMFMFRLFIYMYDLKTRAAPFGLWRALSYFFMLPSACFTLLPVIDYKALQSSHYDDPNELRGYQRGVELMLRGVLHLLLYRLVYQELLVDPAAVDSAGGAVRFLVGTFFLYLRISGYFHFISGMLHMFGFNLPPTHHLYFLASSFTDFWRRINIYWKEFMQKVFFYPVQFPLAKRIGTLPALVVATVYAFAWTWFLHAYQWFWIRGRFPVTVQDAIFWGSLGVAVLLNMLWELRFAPKRSLKRKPRTLRSELVLATKTVATFIAITLVWNVWSTDDFGDLAVLLGHLRRWSLREALWVAGGLIALGAFAVWLGRRPRADGGAMSQSPGKRQDAAEATIWSSALRVLGVAGLLWLFGAKPLLLASFPQAVSFFERLADASLNERDTKLLQRGYYEELADPTRISAELAELYGTRPAGWQDPTYMQKVADFPSYQPIPNASVTFTGVPFRINRWGMRDQDYALQKPPGTYRMIAIGASHTEGQGVPIEQVYHSVIEDRLNRELAHQTGRRYEILNFASGGFGPGSSLARLEKAGFAFQPDAVLFHVIDDYEWVCTETALQVAEEGLPMPYDFAARIAKQAGVFAGLNRSVAEQRLEPHAPQLVAAYYRRLRDQARSHGATPIVVVIPIPEDQADVRARVDAQVALARRSGLQVIDIRSAYDGLARRSDIWTRRFDHHPNAQGHRLLADALYRQLLPVLERASGR
jgi:D-alanyl-lipoteichoic acid acyltransferase DltB (MBOAT superfamily)